jgi:hypothetical protein
MKKDELTKQLEKIKKYTRFEQHFIDKCFNHSKSEEQHYEIKIKKFCLAIDELKKLFRSSNDISNCLTFLLFPLPMKCNVTGKNHIYYYSIFNIIAFNLIPDDVEGRCIEQYAYLSGLHLKRMKFLEKKEARSTK